MIDSKLIYGKIPAHTECPFKNRCYTTAEEGFCKHKGIEHNVDFSCAIARAFDLIDKRGVSD